MTHFDPRKWNPTRRVLAVLAALACGALCLVAVAEVGTTPAPSYVTRSGDKLMLNSKVFRFSGTNIPWGGLDQVGSVLDYPSQFQVNTALADRRRHGRHCHSLQTCGISTGNPQSVEPSLGTFNTTALDHIDYFVAQAGKDGIRLDIPMVDAYDYYVGGYFNFTDWLGLSTPSDCPSAACASQFYNNPRAIAAYRAVHLGAAQPRERLHRRRQQGQSDHHELGDRERAVLRARRGGRVHQVDLDDLGVHQVDRPAPACHGRFLGWTPVT